MSGYRTTCPYCDTRLLGTTTTGVFATFSEALRTLLGHWQHTCETAMPMQRRERDAIAHLHILPVEEHDADQR